MIRDLGVVLHIPWLIVGDFNEILFESEKKGGNSYDFSSIMGFCDAVDACGLKGMGYSGYKFTWSNKRGIIL